MAEMIVRQRTQRVNATPATRTKAKRLVVTEINTRTAFVEGDHDTYQIDMCRLTCSCPAIGRCSHVMAAIREQAVTRGMPHVVFAHSRAHAESWALLQSSKGMYSDVYEHGGYVWCESGKRGNSQVVSTRPDWSDRPLLNRQAARGGRTVANAAVQAAVDEFFE